MTGAFKRTIGASPGHIIYGGAGASELAPFLFPVSIGPFPLQIDYKFAEQNEFTFLPIKLLRGQADQRDLPGEHSINPEGLWRRSGESWHLGAGQENFDRDGSSPFRFRSSLGFDVHTRWQLTMLKDTDSKGTSSETNQKVVAVGDRLYWLDGTALKNTQNILVDSPTNTALTGTPPTNKATSIVSDGFNVWTAHGTQGIWKTTRGTAAWAGAAHITGTVSLLGFCNGRVLAANANNIYDVTALAQGAGGALPGPLFTQPNTDFVWKSFAEGPNAIYAAGYSGDKSLIYKIVVKSDGSGLDQPVVARKLPDGELVECLYGYLGPFMFIGLSGLPGWRFSLINQNGDLTVGARVETPGAVTCFEGQENFVWFGYSNYDASHTGLGRINTAEFGDEARLVPAYSSDLMVIGQTAAVTSIQTFQGIRVFTVSGVGYYAEHHSGNLVPSATLDTGDITFGMNQDKVSLYVDVISRHSGESTHGFYLSTDGGAFGFLGEHTEHVNSFLTGQAKGRNFELRLELKRDSGAPTLGQLFKTWLFRSQPASSATRVWKIPVIVADVVLDDNGDEYILDPWAMLDYIELSHQHKTVEQLRIGDRSYPVVIDDYTWYFRHLSDPQQHRGFNATCVLELKSILEEF